MKILKIILLVIIVLTSFVIITPLFMDKEYAVEREIIVNKPKTVVFDYIKPLKNQDNFSVWAMRDPNMKKEFRGVDATVGFVSAWDSDMKEVGKGEQEIVGITEGERIDYELRFKEPFEAKDHAYISTEALDENQTRVKWGFKGKMDYPMNIMLLFMDMDEMMGKDLETGLSNMKMVLEKN